MPRLFNTFQFVLITLVGWMNERQQQIIEYLREENRVLREQLGGRRLWFNDVQRRRLAVKAKALGRRTSFRDLDHYHAGDIVGMASGTDRLARSRSRYRHEQSLGLARRIKEVHSTRNVVVGPPGNPHSQIRDQSRVYRQSARKRGAGSPSRSQRRIALIQKTTSADPPVLVLNVF